MPNNPRQDTKRKIEYARNGLNTAGRHLIEASAKYRPGYSESKPEGYPQYYNSFDAVLMSLSTIDDVLADLYKQI